MIMVLSMGMVSVNAAENDVEARARLCPNCGIGMTKVRRVIDSRITEVKCTHKPHGTDLLTQNRYSNTETCPKCGATGTVTNTGWITVKTDCHGYN